jgi:protein-S-isoprenylcysteine O-methyltransferase Ste14
MTWFQVKSAHLAMIVMMLGWPLILGSARSFVPDRMCIVLFVLRTALEDRTLRRELSGYEEYTQATGYRLLPGIW